MIKLITVYGKEVIGTLKRFYTEGGVRFIHLEVDMLQVRELALPVHAIEEVHDEDNEVVWRKEPPDIECCRLR